MSGVRGLNSLGAYPIPTVPLVDATGLVTPGWYRFFMALATRTGGTSGRVTPIPTEPLTLLMGLLTQETVQEGGTMLVLGDAQNVQESTQGIILADVAPQVPTVLSLNDAVVPQAQFVAPLDGASQPGAPETLAPGGSPYSYTPGIAGTVIVSGGTVSAIDISRNGTTWLATGETTGMFPLERTDTIRVTYTVLPNVYFLQRVR